MDVPQTETVSENGNGHGNGYGYGNGYGNGDGYGDGYGNRNEYDYASPIASSNTFSI